MRGLLICALIIMASGLWPRPSSALPFSSKYDLHFKLAAKRFLPVPEALYGWQILKAQAWQESRLNPLARSPVGAEGVMQFMPGTWGEAQVGLSHTRAATDPEASIYAGAWYMARMRTIWRAPRPERDRYSLALASYNAGAGHLITAQRLAGGANDWETIAARLPEVTGEHARETLGYVPAIWRYWGQMRVGL